MRFSNLNDWLRWQETLHPKEIELGLERVAQVFHRLHDQSPPFTTITVAGTNGKGSCVAMLESVFQSAGYRTGAYTSPHLLKYNERIHIDGREVTDDELCTAFENVDQARGDITLTYFEFGTLAALDIFYRQTPDIVILEVGLGGRLDAVNIIDADVALVTPIDIDHRDWLGNTREEIAREKAGILRHKQCAVCADPQPPSALLNTVRDLDARMYVLGKDFHYELVDAHWRWQSGQLKRENLAMPSLRGEKQVANAAAVLQVMACLQEQYPVPDAAVNTGLQQLSLQGRFQLVPGEVTHIFDVAHNPQAAQVLATNLANTPCEGETHAVVGMLADKDIEQTLDVIAPLVDSWYITGIEVPRGSQAGQLEEVIRRIDPEKSLHTSASALDADRAAVAGSEPGDRIVVFGSFYVVAEVMQHVI